jgi:hypothetical protein
MKLDDMSSWGDLETIEEADQLKGGWTDLMASGLGNLGQLVL